MATTILHGENVVQSRQKLHELEAQAKSQGLRLKRLEAKSLTPAQLEEALGGVSLFAEDQLIVIEELHSLAKSARQKDLIQMVANTSVPLILWEKRTLTKTMLAQLGQVSPLEFKVSSSLFKWLDALSPQATQKNRQLKLLTEALAQEDEQLCFLMLIRQVRLLLQAKAGGTIKGAPFMITKLKQQSGLFSLDQLTALNGQLLTLDLHQKTSSSLQTLSQELAILILRM